MLGLRILVATDITLIDQLADLIDETNQLIAILTTIIGKTKAKA